MAVRNLSPFAGRVYPFWGMHCAGAPMHQGVACRVRFASCGKATTSSRVSRMDYQVADAIRYTFSQQVWN